MIHYPLNRITCLTKNRVRVTFALMLSCFIFSCDDGSEDSDLSSAEESGNEAGMSNPGSNTNPYCSQTGPGCMVTTEENGITINSCMEVISDGIPLPPSYEQDCVSDANATKVWLPSGCPKDNDMICGISLRMPPQTALPGLVSVIYAYLTGDTAIDTQLQNACACTSCCLGMAAGAP